MKTIAITISRGSLAKNYLQNDFFRILRERFRVIVLTPAAQDDRFVREFSHPNVEFVTFEEYPWSATEALLVKVGKMLMWSDSVRLLVHYGIPHRVKKGRFNVLRVFLATLFFLPLSRIPVLKRIMRFLDRILTQRSFSASLRRVLREKEIDFLFCTNLFSDSEVALIKAAKKEHVPVWGMPKSWDNLGNVPIRALPDRLCVWNEFMVEQAMRWHAVPREVIRVTGILQFDAHLDESRRWSRAEFCKRFKLDPKRKIILFGSEGRTLVDDPDIARMLASFVAHDSFPVPSQLLIRPHFGYHDDELRFMSLKGLPSVALDTAVERSRCFKDEWDYGEEFTTRFINTLYHADVLVTTGSTLCLDVACFDTPTVNIGFDGYAQRPFHESVRFWYHTEHAKELLRTNSAPLVRSERELKDAVFEALVHKDRFKSGRDRLRKRLCHNLDGKVGKRLAQDVIDSIG